MREQNNNKKTLVRKRQTVRKRAQGALPTICAKQKAVGDHAIDRFAGAVRLGAALFVWRVRESCTRHAATQLFAAQKHGVSLGTTARMASTSAKMP